MSAAKSFKKRFSTKSLIKIYTQRIKESGAIGLDRVRPANLDKHLTSEIKIITTKTLSGKYIFTPYKEKLISKGANSFPRQISIPTARDRIVLRALCECLTDVFPTAKLTIPQIVIDSLKNAINSKKYHEYIKIDLQRFYPSIPHKLIKSSIKYHIRKPELRALIEQAITTPTVPESKGGKGALANSCGVPQGLAVSNILAEISLRTIDEEIHGTSGIWYKRYVDDILILTPQGEAAAVAANVIKRLESLGLSPHPIEDENSKSKLSTLDDPFSFLGYQIDLDGISIRKESILKFESSLAKILTAYKHKLSSVKTPKDKERAIAYCEWKLNLRITGCVFEGKRMGWIAYFSQITSTSQLRGINKTIKTLINRFKLSSEISPKSLIKTFYELKRGDKDTHKYIPNFDKLTISQQRQVLALSMGSVSALSDTTVQRMFKFRILKEVRELEEDIANIS